MFSHPAHAQVGCGATSGGASQYDQSQCGATGSPSYTGCCGDNAINAGTGGTLISACGQAINGNTNYYLNSNLGTDATATRITIPGNKNVKIDLQGYTVTGRVVANTNEGDNDGLHGPGHQLLGWNNGVNRQVFGGWQISGVTTIQSETPFTVFNSSQDFSGFNQFNDRPDVVGSAPLIQNNGNPDAAFDIGKFGCSRNPVTLKPTCPASAMPPTGRVGTSGRNQYYGPGLQNFNFALAKVFPLGTERVRLRFRADFFNLFNHTNFSNPVGSESSANFGKITSTVGSAVATAVGTTAGFVGGQSRIIQGALRVEF
jgi:hypothetical protein